MGFLKDFETNLKATPLDPTDEIVAAVQRVLENRKGDIADDIYAQHILANRPMELESQLKEMKKSGRIWDWKRVVTAFDFDLLRTTQAAFSEGGILEPITGSGECKKFVREFTERKWNGFEVRALAQGLHDGERIRTVDCRQVVTSERPIGRYSDFFDELRPSGVSREHWFRQCTPEKVIVELENAERREAEQAARPFSDFSGPNVAAR